MAGYYDALVAKSDNDVSGGPSDWQLLQLDPLLRYYSRLGESDSYFISRPDGTSTPNLAALTGGQIPQRPGFKDDSRLLQLVAAGLNFFPQGLEIGMPNATHRYIYVATWRTENI